jgi:hypothetical protein
MTHAGYKERVHDGAQNEMMEYDFLHPGGASRANNFFNKKILIKY